MPTYTPNAFAAQGAQAQALRNYAPNQFATPGSGIGVRTGAMAPHLSQQMPVDPYIAQAYREFLTDPQAKQHEQYGVDLDRIWRTSPNASIFQPGYQHNQFALQRADQLRRGATGYGEDPVIDYDTYRAKPRAYDPEREGSGD